MNRPNSVKPDNFFLLLFNALRQRRIPLALRIASHSLLLVVMALLIYTWVMGMQFKQAMQQQADALGQSLIVQTAASATELLVSNDILSLNILLNNLEKNPLVAHAAIYSVDNRILAEAGSRPKQGLLGETEGLYSTPITFQEVIAGHLRISLDMHQFEQPMTVSLQSMGLISLILLLLTLTLPASGTLKLTTPPLADSRAIRHFATHPNLRLETPEGSHPLSATTLPRSQDSLMTDYQALLARYDAPARAAITPPPATLAQPATTPGAVPVDPELQRRYLAADEAQRKAFLRWALAL